MLSKQEVVAFIATSDADRARRFYAEALGLVLLSEDGFALVFDVDGTTLRVQKLDSFQPQPFTSLGWMVADLEGAVRALLLRGVRFERYHGMDQDVNAIWSAPSGARVAWFKDPDGNLLSLTQLDRP